MTLPAALHLRPATADDAPIIRQMIREAQLDPSTLKWQNFLVVAQADNGQMVGIGQIKRYRDCEELGSLVVLPEFRGQGVAAALIAALEARAGRPLYLLCGSHMQPYYERFGYHVIRWREAPGTLRLKLSFALPFRLFGIRVLVMRKD